MPTPGAVSKARDRLSEEPLKRLFERVAVPMARRETVGGFYHQWRLMAIDGVVIDIPDTPDNVAEFGRTRRTESATAYPQVKIVGLGECGTHAVVGARIGARRQAERELVADLVPDMSEDMLVLADRGFYSYDLWHEVRSSGAHTLWRVISTLDLPVLEVFPDGSYRSHLHHRDQRREINRKTRLGSLSEEPAGVPIRLIEYSITNRPDSHEVIRLITSITDHEAAPAAELAALYHERWEFEILLDEIETHQIGAPAILRSRKPNLVRQEIWALLLTHYAIRDLMREAADAMAIDPDRLSFIRSLRITRRQLDNPAGFSPS